MSDRQGTGHETLIARYGDQRRAILRTLYSWLNLTLLLIFGWPAVIFFANAPALRPRYMSNGWYTVRLLITLTVLLLVVRFWRTIGIPGTVARVDRAMALLQASWGKQQIALFLLGTTVILTGLLLGSAFGPAVRILALGLAEALAVQTLIAGYVTGVLNELDTTRWQVFATTTGLFVTTFAIRSVVAAATRTGGGSDMVLTVLLAGAVVGGIIGIISMLLRNRTNSLMPGILAHWLFLTIIPAFLEG